MTTPGQLTGTTVRLRPVAARDVEPLLAIVRFPEVAAVWGDIADEKELVDELTGRTASLGAPTQPYVIEAEGKIIGWIQWWEEPDKDYRHAGMDIFLDPSFHGRNLGPEALRLVCRYLFEVRGHHRITIDPALSNTRAIRAYEKVGFRRVGVMRCYERGADGTWHDGLLMDMLRQDFLAS